MTGGDTDTRGPEASGPKPPPHIDRLLVIKHGALGDFVQALGPFAAIRRHHHGALVTLLTTAPFAKFAEASCYFDVVWVDTRPSLWSPATWLALRRRLRAGRFDRIYDLQTSDRSGFYFRLVGPEPRPEWSGVAKGCSHPHANVGRDAMHTIERQREQLAIAGIVDIPLPDVSWVPDGAERFDLETPYILLVPGGSAHRPEKRWPARNYAAVTRELGRRGYAVVLLGTAAEEDLMQTVVEADSGVRNLAGQTSYFDIVGLARNAVAALGNDTGPMHLITAAGCPTTVLFSSASDPALCAPRAAADARPATILRRDRLVDLAVDEVLAAFAPCQAVQRADR